MITLQQAEVLYMRGELHHEQRGYDDAIEDFNKVLEFVKDGGVDKSNWLAGNIFRSIARSYKQTGNIAKAFEYLDEGVDFLSE